MSISAENSARRAFADCGIRFARFAGWVRETGMIALANFRQLRFIPMALLLSATFVLPQTASSKERKDDCSQDCALEAFRRGDIRPLADVLTTARENVPGEAVKIELRRKDGAWTYKVKILTPSGRRREAEINATTLVVIKID